ncbi:MAG: hypothetical protein EA406_05515 [Rhodospirillales bacterium]|nr:MAG: hypothetical protein EA406_05515 [Rhodospirillales bacterium]
MNIDRIVQHYLTLRTQVKEIEARHKLELSPIKEDMALVESALMKHLQDQGAKSLKTAHGTPYISEVESIKIVDRNAVIDTVIQNDCWDVLNISVAKKNLREAGVELPGLEVSTIRKLNVRSS